MACFIGVWEFFYRARLGGEVAEGGERVAALWFKDSRLEGVGYYHLVPLVCCYCSVGYLSDSVDYSHSS
jgi:hypothetical protein